MAEIKWIKITTNMFEDEKIEFIESLPEADSILVIWIKLLAQAGKMNQSGFIFLTEKIPYTDEMLAHKLRRPLTVIRMALETFKRLEMIEYDDMGFLKISNWEKHQSIDKLDKIREDNRKRVAAHRKRLQLKEAEEEKTDSNVTVTLRNNNVTGQTKTKTKTETKNKNKNRDIVQKQVETYTDNPELQETITAFIEMRKSIKKPLTEKALSLILSKLNKIAANDDEKIRVLNNSIMNSWQGVFQLKGDETNGRTEKHGGGITEEYRSEWSSVGVEA